MKKKKLMKIKKRLDKLETALFFQEQRLKELRAKVEPEKFVTFKRFQDLPPIARAVMREIGGDEK